WCNLYMEEQTGYTLSEMQKMGKTFFQKVMHPQSFPKAMEAQEVFKQSGEAFTGVCRVKYKGNHKGKALNGKKWMWLYGSAVPFSFDEDGNVKEVISCFMELKGKDTPKHILRAFYSLFRTQLKSSLEKLTPRETEIMGLFLKGKKNNEIVEMLCISTNTLKTHKRHIFEKLGSEKYFLLLNLSALIISGG